VILPIGISFYTFHTITYIADSYRGHITPTRSFWEFGAYVSLFSQLVAGPIVRFRQIEKDLENVGAAQRVLGLPIGLSFIAFGMLEKVLIADSLAYYVDPWLADYGVLSTAAAWLAMLGYTFQLYFDFSGYSAMAVGLGLMFGLRIPQNFNSPYRATNPSDFWRRWHISLSTWFRDYLYIPLGGNRHGPARTYANLVTVFFLCGLWHGASWTFVLWGGIHGTALSAERFARERFPGFRLPAWVAWLVTFNVVCVAWVFFRAPDLHTAFAVLGGLGLGGPSPLVTLPLVFLVVVSVAIQALPREWWRDAEAWLVARPVAVQGIAVGAVIVAADAAVGQQGVAPFIYYQF
jgi:alginate O-acetyltransferase complex protein AlgI